MRFPDDYRVEELLYESAVNRVWRATRVSDNTAVVLKQRLFDRYRSSGPRDEFQILSQVIHPNIIHPIAIESVGTEDFLVTECLPHHITLEERLQNSTLTAIETTELAIHIARALARIHSLGYVHRDICPANILVDPALERSVLIDFDLARRAGHRPPETMGYGAIEGHLVYLPPEQSGRLSRPVDFRSDHYALGMVLYKALTGKAPFEHHEDPRRLIYAHLAEAPIPILDIDSRLSPALCAIVHKLCAKTPEQRYQGSQGLLFDLERLRRELPSNPALDFEVGQQDVSEQFQISPKIYGRDRELQSLRGALARASRGQSSFSLLAGYSGSGKSSLVDSLLVDLASYNAILARGKFDMGRRHAPYGAVLDALRDLIRKTDTLPAPIQREQRTRSAASLERHGRLIERVLPEIASFVGQLPELGPLSEQEQHRAFHRTITRLILSFARDTQPLVLFLDDLQWADHGSLRLIKTLLLDTSAQHLLIIGAYRNNEVAQGHPLKRLLRELEDAQAQLQEIAIPPLDIQHTRDLVGDTLANAPGYERLAQIIHERTQGNAFFVGQFLSALHRENHIYFDPLHKRWAFHLDAARALKSSENVVELLLQRLNELSQKTQVDIATAALLGDAFSAALFCAASATTPSGHRVELEPALEEGFLIESHEHVVSKMSLGIREQSARGPISTYRFAHDRVRQAALMLPILSGNSLRLTVLERLLKRPELHTQIDWQDVITEIARTAIPYIDDTQTAEKLLAIYLGCAQRAMDAAAFDGASDLYLQAHEILRRDHFRLSTDLIFQTELQLATAQYGSGQRDAAHERLSVLAKRCETQGQRARVARAKILYAVMESRLHDAVDLLLDLFALYGRRISRHPPRAHAIYHFIRCTHRLTPKRVEGLVRGPKMRDADAMILQDSALGCLVGIFQLGYENLYIITLSMVLEITHRYGLSPAGAQAIATFGLVQVSQRRDYVLGKKLMDLAMSTFASQPSLAHEASVQCIYALFAAMWHEGIGGCRSAFLRAHRLADESGELWVATTSLAMEALIAVFQGIALPETQENLEHCERHAQRTGEWTAAAFSSIQRRLVTQLVGSGPKYAVVHTPHLTESNGELPVTFVFLRETLQLFVAFHLGDYDLAWSSAIAGTQHLKPCEGLPVQPIFSLYRALVGSLNLYVPGRERTAKRFIKDGYALLRAWHRVCPDAALPYLTLLDAALRCAHLQSPSHRRPRESLKTRAIQSLDHALAQAEVADAPHLGAVGAEIGARWANESNMLPLARHYAHRARAYLMRWKAGGALEALAKRHRAILALRDGNLGFSLQSQRSLRSSNHYGLTGSASGSARSGDPSVSQLYFEHESLMRATTVLSNITDAKRLLEEFMHLTLEAVAATKGVLLVQKTLAEGHDGREEPESSLMEFARGHLRGELLEVRVETRDATRDRVPIRLLESVFRRGTRAVIGCVPESPQVTGDSYLHGRELRSILAAPIRRGQEIMGVLYLENAQLDDAFDEQQVAFVELLAGQIGLSLDNSRLVTRLNQSNAALERKNLELSKALKDANLAAQAKTTFLSNTSHELRTPLNGIIGMAELLADSPLDDDQQSMLDALRGSAEYISGAITTILEFSALDSGEVALQSRDFELNRLFAACRERATRLAAASDVEFIYHCDQELNSVIAVGDGPRLQRIIEQLLDNAFKFTEQGHVTLQIRNCDEETSSDSQALCIEVSDTGCGMSALDRQNLFHLFTPGDASMTKQNAGLGVGLALVKRSLDLMRGRLEVESEVHRGTTMRIWLRLRRVTPRPSSTDPLLISPDMEVRTGEYILVVEDNNVNARLMRLMLAKLGARSRNAQNGLEAVKMFRASPLEYSCILMDCQLPVMDGYEATAHIRSSEDPNIERLPIIAVTANALPSDVDRCLGSGMDDVLTKPVSADQLRRALLRWQIISEDATPVPMDAHIEDPDQAA